ncbi:MAG: hypothetical protein BZ138_08040 [Methanosphaera sp. rholeuAM270]|nr:MAG: hypothetical protein BZ138_08040 [Methanosphaera sp. rholeuAM270]
MSEAEILNDIEAYDKYYGLNYNQTILVEVSLENEYFKNRNVESVLNIFLFEEIDDEDAYVDYKHEYLHDKYVKKHPEIVERMVKENYKYY